MASSFGFQVNYGFVLQLFIASEKFRLTTGSSFNFSSHPKKVVHSRVSLPIPMKDHCSTYFGGRGSPRRQSPNIMADFDSKSSTGADGRLHCALARDRLLTSNHLKPQTSHSRNFKNESSFFTNSKALSNRKGAQLDSPFSFFQLPESLLLLGEGHRSARGSDAKILQPSIRMA